MPFEVLLVPILVILLVALGLVLFSEIEVSLRVPFTELRLKGRKPPRNKATSANNNRPRLPCLRLSWLRYT